MKRARAYISEEQRNKVLNQVNDLIAKAREMYRGHGIQTPVVLFDLTGTTAGEAWGSYKIRLNSALFAVNESEFYNDTIPHEVAHIVQHTVYPHSKPHGSEWRSIMRFFGYNPTRKHKMDCTAVRRRKATVTVMCTCCSKEFPMGITKAKRMFAYGSKKYHHRTCGHKSQLVLKQEIFSKAA